MDKTEAIYMSENYILTAYILFTEVKGGQMPS